MEALLQLPGGLLGSVAAWMAARAGAARRIVRGRELAEVKLGLPIILPDNKDRAFRCVTPENGS